MTKFRLAAIHLALAAMLLRAFLPAGWMPSTEASGSPLVICTMHGPLVLQPTPHKRKANAGDICPFAAAALLAEGGKAPVLALPQAAPAFAEPLADRVHAVLPAWHTPQSPRAPPRFL
jgi:hypothetical protein